LKGRLLFRKGTVVTSVPYHLEPVSPVESAKASPALKEVDVSTGPGGEPAAVPESVEPPEKTPERT
jgi:hypothetical protein